MPSSQLVPPHGCGSTTVAIVPSAVAAHDSANRTADIPRSRRQPPAAASNPPCFRLPCTLLGPTAIGCPRPAVRRGRSSRCWSRATTAPRYLREALDSLLAQTYERIEIILLDDASTDATPEIAAEYAGRISYVRQPTNLGIYNNVNIGIAQARGDLIATYHADDLYLPTIVEAQVAYFDRHPEVGAVFCSDIFVDADGREYARLVLPPEVRGEKPLDYRNGLQHAAHLQEPFSGLPHGDGAGVGAPRCRRVSAGPVPKYGRPRNVAAHAAPSSDCGARVAPDEVPALSRQLVPAISPPSHRAGELLHHPRRIPGVRTTAPLATPQALVSYEAHRSEDRLMAAISHYIKGEPADGRRALREVQIGAIARDAAGAALALWCSRRACGRCCGCRASKRCARS